MPEQAPDWFFMATAACGGGTPGLGLFLEVSGFIGIFGVGFTSGGSTEQRQGRGRALHPVIDSGLFWPNSCALGASSGP